MSSNSPKSSENPSATPAEPQAPATTPANHDAGQPFHRGQITWGRPPQAVFRAGPLPRDEGMARLMAMPPYPKPTAPRISGSTANGLGGGNIPVAARPVQPLGEQTPAPKPAVAQPSRPVRPANFLGGSLVPGAGLARPQPAPQPVPQPAADHVTIETVEIPQAKAPDTQTAPKPAALSDTKVSAEPAAPVVETASPAAVQPPEQTIAQTEPRPSRSKLPLVLLAGAGVVALAAGAFVLTQRGAGTDAAPVVDAGPAIEEAPVMEGATGGVAALPEPIVEGEAPQVAPPSTATDTVSHRNPELAAQPPATAPRPVPAAPRAQPAPRPQASGTQVSGIQANGIQATPSPAPQAAPQSPPVVTVTPPATEPSGPPPTVASAPPSDPDAPVVTRPQRLD